MAARLLLLLAAIAVAGCFPTPPAGAETFVTDDGLLCWESGDPASQIGTAIQCEVLP